MYSDEADGLPGNDDVGQMSAWYVFSSLGLYPLDPCGATYEIGRPAVASARLRLEGGAELLIVTDGQADGAIYVAAVYWRGVRLRRSTISHDEIVRGGTLRFVLGTAPADFTCVERGPRNTSCPAIAPVEACALARAGSVGTGAVSQLRAKFLPVLDAAQEYQLRLMGAAKEHKTLRRQPSRAEAPPDGLTPLASLLAVSCSIMAIMRYCWRMRATRRRKGRTAATLRTRCSVRSKTAE